MDKQFPTDEKLVFYVCDAIRQEANNKMALLGIYLGGDIVLEEAPPVVLPSLGVFFQFLDGAGEFAARLQVLTPKKDIPIDVDLKNITIKEGMRQTTALTINVMKFEVPGDYLFRLLLDDRAYDRVINVRKKD